MSNFYVCVDRSEAHLPNFFRSQATEVIVTGPDLLHPLELLNWIDYPLGWSMVAENRGCSQNGKLEVAKLGLYWLIGRRQSDFEPISETIVEAFGQAPICTHTPRDARRRALSFRVSAISNRRVVGKILICSNTSAINYASMDMGVDLHSRHGGESLNWAGWGKLLHLAEDHGWQPEGTAPPDDWDESRDKAWNGYMIGNVSQIVMLEH